MLNSSNWFQLHISFIEFGNCVLIQLLFLFLAVTISANYVIMNKE